MTYHLVYDKSKTAGVTCGTGTAYPSREYEFTPGFRGVRVLRSLVFCVMFCKVHGDVVSAFSSLLTSIILLNVKVKQYQ